MKQDTTRWQRQWHQLDHRQIICTLLQTDNHASTSPLSFYRPYALPAAQPTASKHWRLLTYLNQNVKHHKQQQQQQQQQHLFNGSLSGTTWVSRYKKSKTSLDLLEQEIVSGSGISWLISKSPPQPRQITTSAFHQSTTQFFLQARCPSFPQPTA